MDARLIKLSLAVFCWATYREKSGAAKFTCVLRWIIGAPQQFVFTASGKVHDLKATAALARSAGWTCLFDRGYFSFDLLTALLDAGPHFVIRLKQGVGRQIILSNPFTDMKLPTGVHPIKSDWTVSLTGWAGDVIPCSSIPLKATIIYNRCLPLSTQATTRRPIFRIRI